MKCKNCGNENDADALFCRFCGSRLKPNKNKARATMIISVVAAVNILLSLGSGLHFLVSAIKGPADNNYTPTEQTEYTESDAESNQGEVPEITEDDNSGNEEPPAEVEAVTSEYVIPDSDSRYLSRSELASLGSAELRVARNEIFARHGRKFNDAALQSYFDNCSWYNGTVDPDKFNEAVFNEYEKANVSLLQSVENERK